MKKRKIPDPKPLYVKRVENLLTDKQDIENYWKILKTSPVNSIRCNTLKISPKDLISKLKKYGWELDQPWKNFPEIMVVKNDLLPGELGRAFEHLLGYYYIQELSSMLPMIAMSPLPGDKYLDLCASPGSKTTQAGALMKNEGSIVANEVSMGRMRILSSNLERCGITNALVTKKDGRDLCSNFSRKKIFFDKILVDAPCSGEGTLRSSPKTYIMWNPKSIVSLSKLQKKLFAKAFLCLKVGGEMVYSTCTHAPEENEAVVNSMLKEFDDKVEIVDFELPVKTRPGILEWEGNKFDERVKFCKRVYPQDNNTEGFFISKFRRVKL